MHLKGEYALLLAFLDAPQRPLNREHLQKARGIYEYVFDPTRDVQILRHRGKLEAEPSALRINQIERGVGLILY